MEPSSPAANPVPEPPPVPAPLDSRQRWRIVYRRRGDAPALSQREQLGAWEAALVVSGLPLAGADLPDPRPRLVFAAPLAVGVEAEWEMVDLFLVERRAVAEVRLRLAGSLPAGHELVEVYDVWLGAPTLSGQVVAADYRVAVRGQAGAPVDPSALAAACRALLGAATLPRTRDKGGRAVAYDLRPLVEDVGLATVVGAAGHAGAAADAATDAATDAARVAAEAGGVAADAPRVVADHGSVVLRIRTRFDPARGVGRPEEVVAAVAELLGVPLEVGSVVRERLLLAGEA